MTTEVTLAALTPSDAVLLSNLFEYTRGEYAVSEYQGTHLFFVYSFDSPR